ncbi:hypothetical protein N9544_05870 [Flavobacteriales bacterium]|nr:hypothetical protein [Flavobacteriales bacterium]
MKSNLMNRINHISFFLLGFFLFSISCTTLKTDQKGLESNAFLSQDKLGNIYQILDMKITKFSSELKPLQSNSIYSNGTITSFDSRNPLQLMLFYKQQQDIILLDNTLSQTNKINLTFFELLDLACSSNRDNSFWLYSITTQSLIKTDKTGKATNRFKNIAQLVQRDINPTQLIEHENEVYLFDPNEGLFVFDLYGNYKKRIELKKAENVKFYQKKVFYRVENSVFSYNLLNFDEKLALESEEEFDDFIINKDEILLLQNEKINHKKNPQ